MPDTVSAEPVEAEAKKAVAFLDLSFAPLNLEAACAAITARADRVQPFAYVVTPNVDHVVKYHREKDVRAPLYGDAWLTLNDSRILALLAKRSGLVLPTAAGSDLTALMLESVIDPKEPVVIVGGDDTLIEALIARYGLKDVRWHAPPMGVRDDPVAIDRAAAFIAAQRARFSFVCIGAPQQEMVARATLARGDAVGVGLCVGASLEFLAQRKERAPHWMRKANLEWAHRLASEPGRLWRRYLVEGPEIFLIWRQWLATRGRIAKTSSN